MSLTLAYGYLFFISLYQASSFLTIMDNVMTELNTGYQPQILGCDGHTNMTTFCQQCPLVNCNLTRLTYELNISGFTRDQPFTIPTNIALLPNLTRISIGDFPLLQGTFPFSTMNFLGRLYIYNCPNLTGVFPANMADLYPNLILLEIGTTSFSGPIPDLGKLKRLSVYSLYRNNLSGTLSPNFIPQSCSLIDLSQNFLSGTIPDLTSLPLAFFINLASNNFSGQIPTFNPIVRSLLIGFNTFQSTIPSSFSIHRWRILSMPNANVTGTIPPLFVEYWFHAPNNELTGLIPSIKGPMFDLYLKGNLLTGFAEEFYRGEPLKRLAKLNVENNRITKFPEDILSALSPNFPEIEIILAANNLIAQEFSLDFPIRLTLKVMDFSKNFFNGSIEFLFECEVPGSKLACADGIDTEQLNASNSGTIYFFDSNRLTYSLGKTRISDKTALKIFNGSEKHSVNIQSILFIPLGKQDKDECADGTHVCQQLCIDGWVPLFSYTCACDSGYTLSVADGRSCVTSALTLAQILGLTFGLTAGILLLIISSLLYYYYSHPLHQLPHEISWSFLSKLSHPWLWNYSWGSKSGYYSCLYNFGSKEYLKVESLLTNYFKKGSLKPIEIYAIYNETLTTSFINHWKVTTTRKLESPDQFFACTYRKNEPKLKIMEHYENEILSKTRYNQNLTVPLIPVIHGTDYFVAEKIAQTGFAALSSLDAGFYGKGIYFTTNLLYTLPYCFMKRAPAAIISYVNMGNIFPVNEDHRGAKTLLGGALKSGYNSHFVLTGRGGLIYNAETDDVICDEIVIGQESQILPAFIVTFDLSSCQAEYVKWKRVIPQPMPDAAFQEHVISKNSDNDESKFNVLVETIQPPQFLYSTDQKDDDYNYERI